MSAVRRLVLPNRMSAAEAAAVLADYDDLPIHRWPFADALRRRTFDLRATLSSYDAAFVALAEAMDCPLVTRDAPLARAPSHDAVVEVL